MVTSLWNTLYVRVVRTHVWKYSNICDVYLETIPNIRKIKTLFYGRCDRGSFPEYFETFPSLLDAKLSEIEQFEISGENKISGSGSASEEQYFGT